MNGTRLGKEPLQNTVGAGFPRSARLLRPVDFKRVFSAPTVSADRYFKVIACAGAAERSRLGMAVSRQVDRRAVERNRIKRVVRESFRHATDDLQGDLRRGGGGPVDCVVLPRRECASICNRQLRQSLERHWRRIRTRFSDASGAGTATSIAS